MKSFLTNSPKETLMAKLSQQVEVIVRNNFKQVLGTISRRVCLIFVALIWIILGTLCLYACASKDSEWKSNLDAAMHANNLRDFQRSEALLNNVLAESRSWPQKAETLNNIAITHILQNNYSQALKALKEVKKLYETSTINSDDSELLLAGRAYIKTHMLLYDSYIGLGEYNEANKSLKIAYSLACKDKNSFGDYVLLIEKRMKK